MIGTDLHQHATRTNYFCSALFLERDRLTRNILLSRKAQLKANSQDHPLTSLMTVQVRCARILVMTSLVIGKLFTDKFPLSFQAMGLDTNDIQIFGVLMEAALPPEYIYRRHVILIPPKTPSSIFPLQQSLKDQES